MWTGGDDYKRKLFTSTINAGKLNKVFHGASRLKRAMMAVDISSYAEEEPTDSNKVWYWRESVAWEMLHPLETRTDEDLQSYWDSDSEDEEELAVTGRDMGRMFFLPLPGDQEWEKGYVVEYLRPCRPVEVPTKEDSAGRKVDSSFLADYNLNNSANWRSHKQANVCLDNVLHGPRNGKQTSVPVAEAKSMLGSSNVVPVSSMNVPVDKGQWHMVHFWGNDYTAIDSFPAKPPIFYPCFQSLKDYKLIFTNVREKKDAYTGKVQDWDFRLGTEIFDDGVRQQHNGKRFAQERWDRVLSFAKRYNKMEDCIVKSPEDALHLIEGCLKEHLFPWLAGKKGNFNRQARGVVDERWLDFCARIGRSCSTAPFLSGGSISGEDWYILALCDECLFRLNMSAVDVTPDLIATLSRLEKRFQALHAKVRYCLQYHIPWYSIESDT
eukprot:g6847.t1